MNRQIPQRLKDALAGTPAGDAWLRGLSQRIEALSDEWGLTVGPPFAAEVSCAWVAPCNGPDVGCAVLKVGFPHAEAAAEIDGLAFWSGDPTVRLLAADHHHNAMLLERCAPGSHLRARPPAEQDRVIAGLLQRLWRTPTPPHPFQPLSEMIRHWCQQWRGQAHQWADQSLAREALELLHALAAAKPDDVLLATDLHAGNVLSAGRMPWLVVDPKPFIGDRAFDLTQHLLNNQDRLAAAPRSTIDRFADLGEVDAQRVRLWTFARLAADAANSSASQRLARRLGVD